MIIGVATVKDTAVNVEGFVRRNLANGLDHLVVFTEETGAEAEQVLDAHPAVTHVPTGRGWWGAERPDDLNVRQRQAANLARVALAPFAWAEWIVHIDGDEVALVDRDVVAALPASVKTFALAPLEAVSRPSWPEGRITHFKRLLEDDELRLLHVLGVIAKPVNKSYFHGHVRGKRGVRVRTDLRIGLHTVKTGKGTFATSATDPGLRMLHLDSATVEDFERKWMTLAASGSRAVYRKDRIPAVKALRTLASLPVSDEVRTRYVRRIYELTTVEDFETLDELGLLVEVDPDGGSHRPAEPPAADLRTLGELLAAAAGHSRATLTLDDVEGGYDVLRALLAETGTPPGAAREILDRMATKARKAPREDRPAAAPDAPGARPARLWGRRKA